MAHDLKAPQTCAGCGKTFRAMGELGRHAQRDKSCTPTMRFWGKIEKHGQHDCWLWRGAVTSQGYGCTQWGRKMVAAHKVAFMLTKGDVPSGMELMHSCDTPVCCNPEHLSLGTRKLNALDKIRKGRAPIVIKRLTADDAKAIRELQGKASSGVVAKRFGITRSHVFGIWAGRTWRSA